MAEPDILADTAAELLAAGLPREIVRTVLGRIRQRWGGEECYIRKRDPDTEITLRRALEAGEPVERVARSTGLSTSTIRRRKSRWL